MLPDAIPFLQFPQLSEAKGGAQFIHAVVESENGHVVIGTTAVEALPRAARHSMRPCSLDGVSQGAAAGYDCAAFGGGHVFIAIKAEGGGLTISPDRR